MSEQVVKNVLHDLQYYRLVAWDILSANWTDIAGLVWFGFAAMGVLTAYVYSKRTCGSIPHALDIVTTCAMTAFVFSSVSSFFIFFGEMNTAWWYAHCEVARNRDDRCDTVLSRVSFSAVIQFFSGILSLTLWMYTFVDQLADKYAPPPEWGGNTVNEQPMHPRRRRRLDDLTPIIDAPDLDALKEAEALLKQDREEQAQFDRETAESVKQQTEQEDYQEDGDGEEADDANIEEIDADNPHGEDEEEEEEEGEGVYDEVSDETDSTSRADDTPSQRYYQPSRQPNSGNSARQAFLSMFQPQFTDQELSLRPRSRVSKATVEVIETSDSEIDHSSFNSARRKNE